MDTRKEIEIKKAEIEVNYLQKKQEILAEFEEQENSFIESIRKKEVEQKELEEEKNDEIKQAKKEYDDTLFELKKQLLKDEVDATAPFAKDALRSEYNKKKLDAERIFLTKKYDVFRRYEYTFNRIKKAS